VPTLLLAHPAQLQSVSASSVWSATRNGCYRSHGARVCARRDS